MTPATLTIQRDGGAVLCGEARDVAGQWRPATLRYRYDTPAGVIWTDVQRLGLLPVVCPAVWEVVA